MNKSRRMIAPQRAALRLVGPARSDPGALLRAVPPRPTRLPAGRLVAAEVVDPPSPSLRAEQGPRPIVSRLPVGEHASFALLRAFHLLSHRGHGMAPWAASYRHDPIAFLLDTMGDAINIWDAAGELLYQNRAAAELGVGRSDETALEAFASRGRRFERRCLPCRLCGASYLLEVIREVR